MSESPLPEPKSRPVGTTEHSWCKAVPTGTGITVLSLLFSKPPNLHNLKTTLHNLQSSHPILLSKLHRSSTTTAAATPTYSFLTPATPHLEISTVDLSSTTPPFNYYTLLEHELNQNSWSESDRQASNTDDVMYVTSYTLKDDEYVVNLRCHTAACDRISAVTLLRELSESITTGEKLETEIGDLGKINLGIEDYVPKKNSSKPFWARGVDMIGYSLNSLRLSNLTFEDAVSSRVSQVVRLKMNLIDTEKILNGCKSRGIKLCGVIAAAALIAARHSKGLPDQQWEKYSVVTLIDCRSMLDPPMSSHNFGFYHSAILNTHSIKGGEELWDLAKRTHMAFTDAKNRDKHFWDMNDLNFLMCKAIENPNLTPSSSLRTSFITVFEDPIIDHSNEKHQKIGFEDYIGCSSVHGVGPSIAVFDTIRDGQLDCICVYPSPLHLREQMEELVEGMKRILVEGCTFVATDN